MSFTLELFDALEIPLVLHECRRVLDPDGRIAIVALQEEKNPGLIVRLYESMHTRFPHTVDCRPIDAAKMLQDADFQIVKMNRMSMWRLPVAIIVATKSKLRRDAR